MKTNKTIWLTGVGMICLPTLVCAKQNVQQPNILFILCDDMGYGDLACYGQPYIPYPQHRPDGKRGYAIHPGIRWFAGFSPITCYHHDGSAYRSYPRKRQQGVLEKRAYGEVWSK